MIGTGKIYVLVNSELPMSEGKAAAQVAHAVARLDITAPRTVIILDATTEQLHNLDSYLKFTEVKHHLYIDEGVNEVPPMSATAMALGKFADGFTPDFIRDFQLHGSKKGFLRRK